MGYMRHHSIIITAYNDKQLKNIHNKAIKIFPKVSPIISSELNGYASFFIPPDGSKEGWEESSKGDSRRELFIKYLKQQSCVDWVELQYGDDERDDKILNKNR